MENIIVIKNADVITGDGKGTVIRNGIIAVRDDIIDYVGTCSNEAPMYDNAVIIDAKGKAAMPGLVNAHTHSPMTLLRNYADDMPFHKWLFEHIIPAENNLSYENIELGAMLACLEMIKGGTTCFADMYMYPGAAVKAAGLSGLKANISKGAVTSSKRAGKSIIDREGCFQFHKENNGLYNGRIKTSMEIHSIYIYDINETAMCAGYAKELGIAIHTHLAETEKEVEDCISKHGKTPLYMMKECGMLDVNVIAAHGVYLNKEDFRLLKDNNVSIVHCPSSNLKLGNGIAPVMKLFENGINTAIGTDGAASNNNLDMFEEMHIASLLQKGVNKKPEILNASQSIKMAAKNGAKALGFYDTGILEKGKKADIVLIDTDKPHMYPLGNLEASVVYSAKASDVDTVIVDGKILMEKRKVKTLDEEKILYMTRDMSGKIK